MKRRDFLRTVGISSTATAAACSIDPVHWDPMVPMEKAYPYLIQPEQVLPGVSSFYATRCGQCDAGCGVVARAREGRVVKLEGNDKHPVNQGRLCSRGQAGILGSYSPDRFTGPSKSGQAVGWPEAVEELGNSIQSNKSKILWVGRYRTGASHLVLSQFAQANEIDVHLWEPDGKDSQMAATQLSYGIESIPTYNLDNAEVVLSFGMDFLGGEGSVPLSNGWANSRDPMSGTPGMMSVSKTFTVGPRIGATAANSDYHLRCTPGTEAGLALAIAKKLSEAVSYSGNPASMAALNKINADSLIGAANANMDLINDLVAALSEAKYSVVLPGGLQTSSQPTELAAATLLINEVAGNIGNSVVFGKKNVASRSTAGKVKEAILKAGSDYSIVIIDDLDPIYDFPQSSDIASALGKAALFIFANEPTSTTALSNAMILPHGTNLERWGDGEEYFGVHTLQQAVMDPMQRPEGQERDIRSSENVILTIANALKQTVTVPAAPVTDTDAEDSEEVIEDVSTLEGADTVEEVILPVVLPDLDEKSFQSYLAKYWANVVMPKSGQSDPHAFWIQSLQTGGYFAKDESPPPTKTNWTASELTSTAAASEGSGYNLVVFTHPNVGMARNANRSWLQEVSDTISNFSWSTWVEVSEVTAKKLNLTKDKGVEVSANGTTFTAGWFLSPGVGDDTVAITSAGGQKNHGRYALVAAENGGAAFDLVKYSTDSHGALQISGKVDLKVSSAVNAPSPDNKLLKSDTLTMNDRGINFTVLASDLGKGGESGSIVPAHHLPDSSMAIRARSTTSRFDPDVKLTDMYPVPEHPTYRFAMSIDLNRCTGCSACEVACYAENNLPVTGPEEARLSRKMGWIRISSFWEGDGQNPDIRFQPVMCQHCSHAPCEGVCPVLATYHNLDGLNAMIYNRCVGTRYCGNNCPYSARRFNYHTYRWPDSFNLMLNPDVMTREMGIMEKCTFCVQRIRAVKDEHRDSVGFAGQGTAVSDDKLLKLTACAQACPSNAITFGNLKDAESQVTKDYDKPRSYRMLNELNTKPAITYLARIVHEKSKQWEHAFGHHDGHSSGGSHGNEDAGHGSDHGSDNHDNGH